MGHFTRIKFRIVAALFLIVGTGGATSAALIQSPGQATITYTGTDGSIEYDWLLPAAGSASSLGTIHIKPHLNGVAASDITLNPALMPGSAGSPVFQSAQWMNGTAGPVWNLVYRTSTGQFSVYLQITLNGKLLRTSISASQPGVSGMDWGGWPFASAARRIPVPYHTGPPPSYLANYGVFAAGAYDWRVSNASSIDDSGQKAIYGTLTNGTVNTLSETLSIGVSANMADLFPDLGNSPSPYMSQLAGKLVLDVWAGHFDDTAQQLASFSAYGISNCAIILHSWQYFGYDNGLPQHYPANPYLGTDSSLSNLVKTGQSLGCTFALHQNYLDYYPDYPGFDPAALSLTSTGSHLNGWFNPETGLQAYSTKPTAMGTVASQQYSVIRQRYNTDSAYIDVNSALLPWSRADMDASVPGAGKFTTFVSASRDLWKSVRSAFQGPVFGEGWNHAAWSGMLDGAQAQFGCGDIPLNSGKQVPLLVDFDLLKVHPLQVNHGMGLYYRWIQPGDDIHNTEAMDAYRMQEVIFGHAPFITADYWQNPARILVEQNLVGPVAKRYGTQQVSSVQYQFKGNWTDLNTASKAGVWNRVQVRYNNGDTIVANSMLQNLVWQGLTLPAYGWAASGQNLLAYTALRNGIIGDYAETTGFIFANARNQSDLALSGNIAQPKLVSFSTPSANSLTFTFQWLMLNYVDFSRYYELVHFVYPGTSGDSGIVFQCDHSPPFAKAGTGWRPGNMVTDTFTCGIPQGVADGAYSMRVGLYSPSTYWSRPPLAGLQDGASRIIAGTLNVSKGGTVVTFTPQQVIPAPADPRLNSTGAIVDFGTVRTDGMVTANQSGNGWTLRAYPLHRNVAVQVNASSIPQPAAASINCDSPQAPVQVKTLSGGYWQIDMNGAKSCSWQK